MATPTISSRRRFRALAASSLTFFLLLATVILPVASSFSPERHSSPGSDASAELLARSTIHSRIVLPEPGTVLVCALTGLMLFTRLRHPRKKFLITPPNDSKSLDRVTKSFTPCEIIEFRKVGT